MASHTSNAEKEPNWIELAKLTLSQFEKRREIEWKLAFGFWGGIAAFTAGVLNLKYQQFPIQEAQKLDCVFRLIWLLSLVFWLVPLHASHAQSKAWLKYYIRKEERCPEVQNPISKPWYELMQPRDWFWLIGQWLFNGLFLYLSWVIINGFGPHLVTTPRKSDQNEMHQSGYLEKSGDSGHQLVAQSSFFSVKPSKQ